MRGSVKVATSDKDDHREKAKVKKRDERHVLTRMLDYRYQERDGEYDRKTGGKTRKRDMESVVLKADDELDRTKRKNDIQYDSGDPR